MAAWLERLAYNGGNMAFWMREFGIKDPNGYALIHGEDISKK